MPPYGGAIAQQVYYADSELCDQTVDTTKGYPERKDDKGKKLPWQSPFILMVDRGGCTFVQKVRNAQRAGAAGVLIADNTCLCSDLDCKSKTGITDQCENAEPIMADDGSGKDISIPSFLMFKHDADPVKDELRANRPVQIEMAWALPNPDDRVEYDLWTTPSDVVTKDFWTDFAPLAKALGKSAYFTPHMYIHNGLKMGCQTNGENFCYTLCTNNGRYCATDPDNDLDRGISGADVVRESLRRLCIWEEYGANDGIGEVWWNYMKEFNDRCRDTDYFANDDCIADAYKHSKVDKARIDKCIADSNGTEEDKINTKLVKEINSQEQRGVVVIPSAFVNTAALRGGLTPTNVFTAICAGFSTGTAPPICEQCGTCIDAPGCVRAGYCKAGSINGAPGASAGGVSTHTFATSLLLVVVLFSGLGVWHYKRTQDEMRDQVRGILADYLPLEDQEPGGGGHSGMMMGSGMDFAGRGGISTSLVS